MSVTVISHQHCKLHTMGEFHPETPLRLASIEKHIAESELASQIQQLEAHPIELELIQLVHDQNYIDYVFANSPSEGEFRLDPDTSMNPHTLEAALLAAGSGIQGVDNIMQKKSDKVFCSVRPPGHHAEKHRAMGFCFFDNIAIAAAYALKHYEFDRVAVLDFDVHHGNGTENIMTSNDKVLFCSTFQHPFYPFSGDTRTPGHIVNTPLPAGAGSNEFRNAIKQDWLPALEKFQPQMIFISAGFDAHEEDNMAQLNLRDDDYFWVTEQIVNFANNNCEGRILSMLEGGYALDALGRSVVAHLKAMV